MQKAIKEECDYKTKWKGVKGEKGELEWSTRYRDTIRKACHLTETPINCNYVLKILKDTEYKLFQHEKKAFERVAGNQAPKLHDSYFCAGNRPPRGDGFLFLEAFDGDLKSIWDDIFYKEWMKDARNRQDLFQDVVQLYVELVSTGVVHTDLHGGNVLYRRREAKEGPTKPTLVITDFGKAEIWGRKTSMSSITGFLAGEMSRWIPDLLDILQLSCKE